MRRKVIGTLGLALFTAAIVPAQTTPAQPGKIAVINMQAAIVGTKDGQKAAADLDAKFGPKRKAVDAQQAEINQLREQLQKGQNTLSDAAKNEIYRNVDQKTKALNRDMEDDQADLEQDQQRFIQEIGQKLGVVINKYARDNGYSLVIDVSGQQSPIIFASNTIDITKQIIDLYDANAAAMAPGGASAPKTQPGTTK